MGELQTVVLLVPIAPDATGNGLAMRAGMLLDALAHAAAVHLVVVPVSGSASPDACTWAASRARSLTVIPPVTNEGRREHVTLQLSDPDVRERLRQTAPLPARAAAAPPTLADAAIAGLPATPSAVLAMRLYLAPLGVTIARRLAAERLVIDADDDDGALFRSLGDTDSADAFDRLARCWLPDADRVLAASPVDAAGIVMSAGLDDVMVVPNTVVIPATVPLPPAVDRLLFVGNLTYEPNRVAARVLAEEVLPLVRHRRPTATLDLVGAHGGALDGLADAPGVRLAGAVPDVAPFYAGADAVVIPLRHGSGTRIKVIEAFAHRRPVVATPVAVAGLDVEGGRELVIADSIGELADAASGVLDDPGRAAALVERAASLVETRYSPMAVTPLVRDAVLGRHRR